MKLIRLTSIENRDIAVVADKVISIEKGNYLGWEKYGFGGRPTRIVMFHHSYDVREDFDTVYALIEGTDND